MGKKIQILKNKNDDLDKYTKICNEIINELENKIKELSNEKNTSINVNKKWNIILNKEIINNLFINIIYFFD